jgi:catechol 2,3-dioxygenase-like lactoylglutathione lyase family enzyme
MDPLFLGLRHVALNVRNVTKSIEFYSGVLGMELEWMPDEENAYLTSGGHDNLALHRLPLGTEPGKVQLIHHIGFIVGAPESVDLWADRIRSHGIPLAAEPKTHRDGARSFYFHDPDGLLIQLIYHPPIARKAGEAST